MKVKDQLTGHPCRLVPSTNEELCLIGCRRHIPKRHCSIGNADWISYQGLPQRTIPPLQGTIGSRCRFVHGADTDRMLKPQSIIDFLIVRYIGRKHGLFLEDSGILVKVIVAIH